ncbi:Regulatory protein SdiA [compost metagenome]
MEIWIETQLKQLACVSSIESAYKTALNFLNNLGYEYCCFSMTSCSLNHRSNTINLNNYPHKWNTQYKQKNYCSIDPIVAHCNHSMLPILWDSATFAKTPDLWQALLDQGLQNGWSQPAHDRNNPSIGILSMARSHRRLSVYELYEHLGYATLISQKLYALAIEKLSGNHTACDTQVYLSPREIEVLKWSADGKTASEIAIILCLTERTVHFHVSSAIKKLGVNNKISAVVRAAKYHMF